MSLPTGHQQRQWVNHSTGVREDNGLVSAGGKGSQENILEPQGAHLQARCLSKRLPPAQAVGEALGLVGEALGKGPGLGNLGSCGTLSCSPGWATARKGVACQ